MEQTINNVVKKQNQGRRKIEIKKIENKSSRQVTFTKRRTGLFRKASELCVLTGAKIAIIATSQKGKLFTFGHPNVATIIDKYQRKDEQCSEHYEQKVEEEDLSGVMGKLQFLEAERNHLKELKKDEDDNGMGEDASWWRKVDVTNMELADLEQFRDSLQELRNNFKRTVEEKMAMDPMMMAGAYTTQNFR